MRCPEIAEHKKPRILIMTIHEKIAIPMQL